MLYIHVARGIVARCTIVEYESWMDQREVWGRHRLRIIKEIEAFGIAFSKEVRAHQRDMVRMKVEPDTFLQIRNHWFDLEKKVEGHQHWFERKQRQLKQMN